ncbi:MAG: HNH endonuclease [Selenomonadaceae bacterium]|nr:HNH endonuclease [Selenomonadaceae bacterium]
MNKREKCVYCGNRIISRSKEHIIQNALGGLYETDDICCDKCNGGIISRKIDAPFTKIFSPIIAMLEDLPKTHNTKSKIVCDGLAIHNGKEYDVKIKNNKVVACLELSKELKCDASELEFEIKGYRFDLENEVFKNGFCKIAFNFALDKGIDLNVLSKGVNVQKSLGVVDDISFRYLMLPFVALNPLDEYIELDTKMELYHNLVLFSQGSMLWCYVDLFNTFQYYVLLSDEWDEQKQVFETYMQLLQKPNRNIPDICYRSIKDILIDAARYNVEPCCDVDVFSKRVRAAIQKESLKKSVSDVISVKLGKDYIDFEKIRRLAETGTGIDRKILNNKLKSMYFYFDEDDKFKENKFRQYTYMEGVGEVSYTLAINELIGQGKIELSDYTLKKFIRMNDFLCNHFCQNKKTHVGGL